MGRNNIGHNGICHFVTALQTNTTLKYLYFSNYDWMTDQEVLLLSSAIRNRSIEQLTLDWSSTDPDNTLKEIGESVRRSKLRVLDLRIHLKQPSPDFNEAKRCVEIGGKDLIQSQQENSLLQILNLFIYYDFDKSILNKYRTSMSSTQTNSNNSQHSKTTERTTKD